MRNSIAKAALPWQHELPYFPTFYQDIQVDALFVQRLNLSTDGRHPANPKKIESLAKKFFPQLWLKKEVVYVPCLLKLDSNKRRKFLSPCDVRTTTLYMPLQR